MTGDSHGMGWEGGNMVYQQHHCIEWLRDVVDWNGIVWFTWFFPTGHAVVLSNSRASNGNANIPEVVWQNGHSFWFLCRFLWGQCGCFSFYPGIPIKTSFNEAEAASALQLHHGWRWPAVSQTVDGWLIGQGWHHSPRPRPPAEPQKRRLPWLQAAEGFLETFAGGCLSQLRVVTNWVKYPFFVSYPKWNNW